MENKFAIGDKVVASCGDENADPAIVVEMPGCASFYPECYRIRYEDGGYGLAYPEEMEKI